MIRNSILDEFYATTKNSQDLRGFDEKCTLKINPFFVLISNFISKRTKILGYPYLLEAFQHSVTFLSSVTIFMYN
jgi:hypothetical protein